jgi:hypothetical protein
MNRRHDPFQDTPRREWKRWLRRQVWSAISLGVAGVCLLFLLNSILSPTERNHVVIVNHSGIDYHDLTVTLETGDGQRHVLHKGAFGDNSLQVVNWPNAFYGQWIEVADAGVVIGRVEAISHGRYGHSLIVLLNPDGKLRVSSDKWPTDADSVP